ncbi:MAG: phenylacetate--CoA ligase family protein [Planctomycetes bacterium]|nr:phenylacetate--CoA ligase family protein [Planctomycetota bacterium]
MKLALSRKNLWEKLPRGMKRGLGAVLGAVPLPLILGKRFRSQREWLKRSQWWSDEQIRSHQIEELRRICRLARDNSAFYRERFAQAGFSPDSIRAPEDLQRVPTIDKRTVNENLDAMLTRDVHARGIDYTTTGGTGGQPLRFYINAGRSATEYAYLTMSWRRTGFRVGMPMAVLRGRIVEPDALGIRHERDPLLRHHYFSNFHTTDADLAAYLDRIRDIGPCFLHVYPSSAAALARYLKRSGQAAPDCIRGLVAESEIVYPEQRALIEQVFGRRLFACYGHTEKLVLAAACEHSDHYHVWPTYGYCELLDADGRPVTTPGQRGEIVGTGFINSVTPFIRYRTGDFATYVGARCDKCGRAHLLLDDIEGHRTQEHLLAGDGSEISWTALNMHDDTFDRVRQFQFVQEAAGRATLKIVAAEGFSTADRQRIERNLERKLAGRLIFETELVDSIPLSPRGKAIYVDQRTPARRGGEGA